MLFFFPIIYIYICTNEHNKLFPNTLAWRGIGCYQRSSGGTIVCVCVALKSEYYIGIYVGIEIMGQIVGLTLNNSSNSIPTSSTGRFQLRMPDVLHMLFVAELNKQSKVIKTLKRYQSDWFCVYFHRYRRRLPSNACAGRVQALKKRQLCHRKSLATQTKDRWPIISERLNCNRQPKQTTSRCANCSLWKYSLMIQMATKQNWKK